MAWTAWTTEQRTAAVGAALLVVSTLGPFSFVEAGLLVVAAAVLALLWARGHGKRFELPFGDGALLAAAGAWSGVLITVRVFDRPLGQNLLALGCAGLLALVGLLQRAERPAAAGPPPATPPAAAPDPPARTDTPAASTEVAVGPDGVHWLNRDRA